MSPFSHRIVECVCIEGSMLVQKKHLSSVWCVTVCGYVGVCMCVCWCVLVCVGVCVCWCVLVCVGCRSVCGGLVVNSRMCF